MNSLELIISTVLIILLAIMLYMYSLEEFETDNVNLNDSDMVVNSRYFRDDPKKSTEVNFDVLFTGYGKITNAPTEEETPSVAPS